MKSIYEEPMVEVCIIEDIITTDDSEWVSGDWTN